MKIQVPTEEHFAKEKRRKRRDFMGGLITGLIVFGLIGMRVVFRYGFDKVETYTWIALGFGILSFGLLARWFGAEFWSRISGWN